MNSLISVGDAISLRLATPADAAALRALRLESLAAHPEAFGSDVATAAYESVADWAAQLAERAATGEGVAAVAECAGQLVGMARLFRSLRPKTCHSGTLASVYVRPDWRGRRVAEGLVDVLLAWGRDHGLTVVKLAVVTANVSAVRCYARCGFSVYGLEPRAICYAGAAYDELLMVRFLAPDTRGDRCGDTPPANEDDRPPSQCA